MDAREKNLVLELNRYKKLFRAAEKLHSYMEKDTILEEIIGTLEQIYPEFDYYLLLSQDHNNASNLPVIEFDYESENLAALGSYVSGQIQLESSIEEKQAILYAPLKGKQGVYGVIQVIAPDTLDFPKDEVEFISLLAQTTGSALENAQLYYQSKRVISELELINETSKRLNSNLRLAETMKYMSKQIKQTFEAQEIGFFLFANDREEINVLPGSTSFFLTDKSRIYIDHIKDKILQENDSLFIGDLNLPIKSNVTHYHSIIAVPMIQSKKLKGFSIIMHQKPFFFSFETFKLLQSLIYHSSLALTNSMLREELENMIITDHLTKLHSRNYLDEKIQWSMDEDEEGTFILIDIDNFKKINDTFGHQIGDEILVQVADLIKSNIRGKDVGARWGGEELAIYLPKASLAAGFAVAERLVEKVAECSHPKVTISCGVSYWHKDHLDTYNHLFKRADEALYIAKASGKNKAVAQDNSMRAS